MEIAYVGLSGDCLGGLPWGPVCVYCQLQFEAFAPLLLHGYPPLLGSSCVQVTPRIPVNVVLLPLGLQSFLPGPALPQSRTRPSACSGSSDMLSPGPGCSHSYVMLSLSLMLLRGHSVPLQGPLCLSLYPQMLFLFGKPLFLRPHLEYLLVVPSPPL